MATIGNKSNGAQKPAIQDGLGAREELFEFFQYVSTTEFGDLPEQAHIDRWKEIFDWIPDNQAIDFAERLSSKTELTRTKMHQFLDQFAISPAEGRLLSSLLDGKTVVDHSKIQAISITTARTQMRKLLEKTHSTNQLDLIRAFHASRN